MAHPNMEVKEKMRVILETATIVFVFALAGVGCASAGGAGSRPGSDAAARVAREADGPGAAEPGPEGPSPAAPSGAEGPGEAGRAAVDAPDLPPLPSSDRGGPGRPGAVAGPAPRRAPAERLRLELSGEVRAAPAAWEGDLLLATRNGRLLRVDAATGAVRWTARTLAVRGSGPAVGEGAVFVAEVARNGSLLAFELETGQPRWSRRIGPTTSSPAVVDGLVVILSDDAGGAIAFDARTGEERWRAAVAGWRGSAAVAAGLVVVATDTGLVALSLADGSPAWRAEVGPAGSPAALGGTVVTTLDPGGAVAVALDDGALQWRRDELEAPLGMASIDADQVYLVAGEHLLALDHRDGAERWRAPASPGTSPAVAADTVVTLAAPNRIAAHDARTGAPLWSHALDRPVGALPVVAHGAVIAALHVDLDGVALVVVLE